MLEEEIVPQAILPSSGAPQPATLDQTLQLRSSDRSTHTRKFSEAEICGKFPVSFYELEYKPGIVLPVHTRGILRSSTKKQNWERCWTKPKNLANGLACFSGPGSF